MRRRIVVALIGGALAGCAAEAEKEAARLSLACQVSRCDCISNTFAFFDSQPVQWKQDGAAYCPDGYHLRRLDPAPEKAL
jgi:hypothetical protein